MSHVQIQATLTATIDMQGTAIAVEADRRAREDAAMMRFTGGPELPLDAGKEY